MLRGIHSSPFFFVIMLLSVYMHGQDAAESNWRYLMFQNKPDFSEVVESFNREWDNQSYQSGAGIKPFKRWEAFHRNRLNSEGQVDLKQFLEIKDRIRVQKPQPPASFGNRSSTCPVTTNGDWTSLGPVDAPLDFGIGRLNCIAFNPADSNEIWVGAPSGGVWVSYDYGQSWATFSDEFVNLGVSDIVFNPENPNTIYMATGDRDNLATVAYGILKSEDGGNTWTNTPLGNVAFNHRLLINPNDTSVLLLATEFGVFRSTDAGTTWGNPILSANIRHMEFNPNDPNVVYATSYDFSGVSGFYKSLDNGQSWSGPIGLPNTPIVPGRLAIGVTPANPNVVYMLGGYDSPDFNDFAYMYKSTDQGSTWDTLDRVVEPELGAQFWYDWTIAVDPNDENIIYVGGVDMGRSDDGGLSFTCPSGYGPTCANSVVHVDHHYMGWHPVTGDFWLGTDGGAYYTSDGFNYVDVSDGIQVTQFYRMTNLDERGNVIFSGSQDNGTQRFVSNNNTSNNWDIVIGGDGMECQFVPNSLDTIYGSTQGGNILRSENGGNSFFSIGNANALGDVSQFITTFQVDPTNQRYLYAAFGNVWQYDQQMNTWTNLTGSLYPTLGAFPIQTITVGTSNSDWIYVAKADSIFRTTDGGVTWQGVRPVADLDCLDPPFDYICFVAYDRFNQLVVDPNNEQRIYALARVNGGRWEIHKSEDGGINWTNLTGNLPPVVLNCLAIQDGSTDQLYIGTDVGIYYKDNAAANWVHYSAGLPNVPIFDLELLPCQGTVRAATYGRGIWESPMYCPDYGALCCNNVKPTLNLAGEARCYEESTALTASAAAIGYGYQWYRNGVEIPGATNRTYSIDSAGTYAVRFVNLSDPACNSELSESFKFQCINQYCADLPVQAYQPGIQYHLDIPGLSDTVPDIDNVTICLSIQGLDLNGPLEKFEIFDENGTLRDTTENNGNPCLSPTPYVCYSVTGLQYNTWITDNTLRISLDPLSPITLNCSFERRMCVNIITPSLDTGTVGPDPCPDNLLLEGIIATDTYKAGNQIRTTGEVQSGSEVFLEAGFEVKLDTNFQGTSGAVFNASIVPCAQGLIAPLRKPKKEKRKTIPKGMIKGTMRTR